MSKVFYRFFLNARSKQKFLLWKEALVDATHWSCCPGLLFHWVVFFIIVEENNIDGGKKISKVYARHIKMRCSCFANCFFSCLLIDNGVFDIEPQKNRKKMLPALANLLKEIISFQFVSIPLINPSFLPSLTLPSCYLLFVMFHPRRGWSYHNKFLWDLAKENMTRICRQIETWMAGLKLYWYFCSDIYRDCSKNLDLWLTRTSYLFLDVATNQSFKGRWKVPVLHQALVFWYREEFFLDLTNQQDMSCLFWYSGIQIPTNIINQHQITRSYSKSRVTNTWMRLCNWVVGHHICPFEMLFSLHHGKVEINDLIVSDLAKGNEIRTAG